MITRDYWRLSHPDAPIAASYGTLASCREWRDRDPLRRPPESYSIERVPCCGCCGSEAVVARQARQHRCAKHRDRNPCAIEGCTRTRAVPADRQLGDDQWLCADHWRRFVPPRSRMRRAYHAFFRRAKRQGDWDDKLARRFWRFWNALVRTARRRATAGHLDETEINKLFGWAE